MLVLLLCPQCESIFSLSDERKSCDCGAAWGYYSAGHVAVTSETAIPIAVDEDSLIDAIHHRPKEKGRQKVGGPTFLAWVMPENDPKIFRNEMKVGHA
jgi:hypothetical protein